LNQEDDDGTPDPQDSERSVEALERTVDRFGGWVQFADAKAGAVLVLLGLGLADLLDHAGRLAHAHVLRSDWGDAATALFWIALALAAVVVAEASRALFPRVKAKTHSVYFFGSVANYPSGSAFATAVTDLPPAAVAEQMAEQAWELARIATRKFERLRMAYWFALAFLAAWALARCAMALAV
jgi:hypothetical protein